MMNEYKKAVLFDFDGTLVILKNNMGWQEIGKRIARIYLKNGIPAKIVTGHDNPTLLYLKMYDIIDYFDRDVFVKMQRKVSKMLDEHEMWAAKNVTLVPGCLNTLRLLKDRNIKIGIISINGKRVIDEVLKSTGMECYVDAFYSRDSPGKPKPFPDHAISCLGRFRCEPKRTLMVGDSPEDILTAKRAGITPIGISTDIHLREKLLKAGAHKTIRNMRELINLVR